MKQGDRCRPWALPGCATSCPSHSWERPLGFDPKSALRVSCSQLPLIGCMGGDFCSLEVTRPVAYFLLMMVNVSHLKRQEPSPWGSPVLFLELRFCPLPWLSLCSTLEFECSYLKQPQPGHSFMQPGPCCCLARSFAGDMAVPVTWPEVGWQVLRAGQWLLSDVARRM